MEKALQDRLVVVVKVSVIVPIYNTEIYIEKCLNSLVNQTLRDIEIICVNDGSTDNSMIIVRKFANEDSRIKIIEQENKKQGAARNAGMRITQGEYIGFVDSDDWVDLDYFEKLYNAAKKYDSDIALATNVRVGNGKTKKRLNITEEKFVTTLQDKIDIVNQAKNPCPTNKIYRKEMLEDNNITWPEGVYCEDKLFTIEAIYYSNGVVSIPDCYYYYYRNPNSTVNSKAKKHFNKLIDDKNKAKRDVLNFLKSKIKEDKVQIRDKEFWATKKECRLFGISIFKIEEAFYSIRYTLFGLRIVRGINENT